MSYLNDPREDSISLDTPAIWEADNRVEKRYKWGALITDLCDMTPEEYMKNPVIEAIKNGSEGGGDASCDCMKEIIADATDKIIENNNENTDRIVETITSASTETNVTIDVSKDEIVEAINSAVTVIQNTIHSSSTLEVLFYYCQVNHATDPYSLTKNNFQPGIVVIGSDTYIDYILGDPTPENWQKYLDGEITEEELRQLSSNDYYIAIPLANEGKLTLLENGTADITENFVKVDNLNLFDGYIVYRSIDKDYFNEDYDTETNVKIPFKITIAK